MKLNWRKKPESPRRRTLSGLGQETKADGNIFRRNRTLVGSLSVSVASANELGGSLQSPRAHVHHLTSRRRKLLTVLLYVFVGAGLITWTLYEFTSEITIDTVATGTEKAISINRSRYSHAINEYLNVHPFERMRPLLNIRALTNHLASITPEVRQIKSKGSSGIATSRFEIDFRKPVAGWFINGKENFVDKDGVSFQFNYFDRPTVKIVDNSGVPQTSGSTVISGRFLRFVGRTVDIGRGLGLNVEQAIIPAGTTRQIEVRIIGHTYPIKLSLDRPVGEQVEDMSKAVTFFNDRKIEPNYIDVRVSGRAYYKN